MATKIPGHGFTSARAERWVLTGAMITTLVYVVRRLVEGETSPAPTTSAARAFLGSGAPPDFSQWAIAEGTAFLSLALLAQAVPELAGTLAIFVVFATFIESGGQLATDLQNLEHGANPYTGSSSSASSAASLAAAHAEQIQQELAGQLPGTVYVIGPNGTRTPVSSASNTPAKTIAPLTPTNPLNDPFA